MVNRIKSMLGGLLIFVSSTGVFAQDITNKAEIAWSDPVEREVGLEGVVGVESANLTFQSFAGVDDQNVYARFERSNKLELAHYDHHKNKVQLQEVDLDFGDIERDFLFSTLVGDNYVIFSQHYNKQERKQTIYADVLEKKTLNRLREPKTILELHDQKRPTLLSLERANSENRKYFGLAYIPYANSEQPFKFGVLVFDDQLNVQWENNFEIQKKKAWYLPHILKITNTGDAYLSVLDKIADETADPVYKYQLYSFRNNGQQLDTIKVERDGYILNSFTYEIKNDSVINMSGFYSKRTEKNIKGVYFISFDRPSNKIRDVKFTAFDREDIIKHLSKSQLKREAKKEKKGEPSYELKYHYNVGVQWLPDGSVILFAHEIVPEYDYANYQTILMCRLSAIGDLVWLKDIQKKQMSYQRNRGQINFSYHNGKVYVFFYDSAFNYIPEKLAELEEGGYYKSAIDPKYSVLACAIVDDHGEYTKEVLVATNDTEKMVSLTSLCVVNGDKFICIAGNKDEYNFMRIKFID